MFDFQNSPKLKAFLILVFTIFTLIACAIIRPPAPPKPAQIAVVLGAGASKGLRILGY